MRSLFGVSVFSLCAVLLLTQKTLALSPLNNDVKWTSTTDNDAPRSATTPLRTIKKQSSLIIPSPFQVNSDTGVCILHGSWIDDGGNLASIAQQGLNLVITSVSSGTGWTTANGTITPDGTFITVTFGPQNTLNASVVAACTQLQWSNGQIWRISQPLDNITTVHVVFMTHLDVGFTLLARDVCEEYFDKHFPNGIALSQELRAMGNATPARYAVTSHPWLVMEYLDGATQCARTPRNAAQIQLMLDAIAEGDVRWHGKPMNNFVELEDGPWFDTSLQLSGNLNRQFNKTWGSVTCKSTDVPGMSRSSIPHFAAAGKRAIHLGYNSACRVANIPMAFNWVHEETGTSLLTFVNNNYGSQIVVPGSTHALAFFYSPDNSGPPPNAQSVITWWNNTQKMFPNATLILSSLDDFALAIEPITESLPQVVGEIGQSWSYGAPADPPKISAFRTVRRLRNELVTTGQLDPLDIDLLNYERRLWVGGPEHNWGLCFGCYLPEARSPNGNWSNELFHQLRYRPDYAFIESGNIEKRNMTLPLPPPPTASAEYLNFLDQALELAEAYLPEDLDLTGYTLVNDPTTKFTNCGRFSSIQFSSFDGSVVSLVDANTDYEWVSAGGSLGSFSYKTYTEWDFDRWNLEYNPGCGPPCGDFAKDGMNTANPVNKTWLPTLTGLYQRTSSSSSSSSSSASSGGENGDGPAICSFISTVTLDPDAVTLYGGMTTIWLNITVDPDSTSSSPTLSVELIWKNKTATRLAESAWLSFVPNVGTDMSPWVMDVLGYQVSPLEVVDMGTKHIHAVWDGVSYDARDSGGPFVFIHTLDAPLVSPGDSDHLLWYDGLKDPDLSGGWYFNLENNVWGTAFPQWQGDDSRFRFVVELGI